MIDVVNVAHHYGVKPVLTDVSIRVNAGEMVALMGPNGRGKSTLMGVVAGVLWPVKGHVEIGGKRRRASEEIELAIRQQVVYLSAEPWLPITKTGRSWILSVGRLWGIDDDRLFPHVSSLLDVFDLKKMADASISQYSSGQKKKIALCCALVTEAPVMLLDEPFAGGLDPSGILALKRILQHHLAKRDRTVLMATPVPELVDELADRVAVIADGTLKAFDTPAELKSQTHTTSLAEAYESLVSPGTLSRIDQYFAREQR